MGLEHHQCVRLLKAVYGLVNAPRRWWSRVRKDMARLGWQESAIEPCLWFLKDPKTGALKAMAVAHVDDFMIAIDNHSDFAVKALEDLYAAYEWGSWESRDFVQCGTRIQQEYDSLHDRWGRIHLSMYDYAMQMEEIDVPSQRRKEPQQPVSATEATRLKGAFGQLMWLATQGLPTIMAQLSLLLGYSNCATVNTMLQVNKLIRRAKIEAKDPIILERHANPCVVTFTDAAWKVRRDDTSQGGYLVFVTDHALMQNREAPLSLLAWQSAKLPRVCRSSSAAEVQAAGDGQEEMEFCRLLLSELLFGDIYMKEWATDCARVPGALVLDCRGVFDALDKSESSALGMRAKRSAIEALALKKGMSLSKTSLRWCRSGAQLADCMTKDSEQARSAFNLWKQRRSWKLIYDNEYISEKNRRKRGLATLDDTKDHEEFENFNGYADADDAWQLVPENWLEDYDEMEIPCDSKDPDWRRAIHGGGARPDQAMRAAESGSSGHVDGTTASSAAVAQTPLQQPHH